MRSVLLIMVGLATGCGSCWEDRLQSLTPLPDMPPKDYAIPPRTNEKWCPPNGIGGGQPPPEDQMISDGGEVLWRTSVSDNTWNCGDCGVECNLLPRRNGFGFNVCEGGICSIQCNAGYADCDKTPGNPCEPLPCP